MKKIRGIYNLTYDTTKAIDCSDICVDKDINNFPLPSEITRCKHFNWYELDGGKDGPGNCIIYCKKGDIVEEIRMEKN